MTALATLLRERAARDAARADYDARLATVRSDIAARSVGERIADSAIDTAQDIVDEAIAVANENRAIVAGTIAALAVWFLRTPLIALAAQLFGFEAPEKHKD